MGKRSELQERFVVQTASGQVPVEVYYEYRNSVRASSGKKAVLLRMPRYTTRKERDSYKRWCIGWIHKQWEGNPRFRSTYTSVDYSRCSSFTTFDSQFDVDISRAVRKSGKVHIGRSRLELILPLDLDEVDASDMTYDLIHKGLSLLYIRDMKKRIRQIHGGYFSKPVSSVSLKNMSSKWGSCSEHGGLSFSTKLLFAPREVQDYVILHELCHLDILDHSKHYWDLVGQFDPDYESKEEWLRTEGHLCDLHHHMQIRQSIQLELPFYD